MFVQNNSFYWDCAKFAFSLIGGGTAGYCLVKGVNAVMTRAAAVGEMKMASKMASMHSGQDDNSCRSDTTLDV